MQKAFVEKEKLTVRSFRYTLEIHWQAIHYQYPVLSDVDKETFKAYGIGKGMMGLTAVARVTFIIDKKGIVRRVLILLAC